ncbi:2-oxoisovalerate dehydrogenase subunit alpha 2, mitochondrial [Morella rubra]|uniref:2-oxoisovalerate dehydrogenase subunit alpha 2, mitochondrial n=1 Tax=Morella rubra TaxID=262757 RepID=A0A6A1VCY6_9ROSI|nr:2-oxoisovalerate dehydrogenase subunit alpha 2, mitochondrial [Morella rubra]
MGLLGVINLIPWSSSLSHREFSVTAPNAQTLGDSDTDLSIRATLFSSFRFMSTKAEKQLDSLPNADDNKVLDFPGGKVRFTPEMKFISESPEERAHCYRILDEEGQLIMGSNFVQVSEELAVKMYRDMVTLQTMDTIFYEAQRQGRISFYLTTIGEEAINIATAAALTIDDHVFPQYREPGVLLWRGFTLQEFANQCFGNRADYGKGRQMPIHYGSNKHNYFTVSSTIATQIPHAVGAAYSLKMDRKKACAVTYFGDGGTSEGDFHAALNFAAVMEAPVIFVCRNNGWAISTPTSDQFRSDGVVVRGRALHWSFEVNIATASDGSTQIPHAVGAAYSLKMDRKKACAVTYFGDGGTSDGVVVRGRAYGVRSIRVDGNDPLAIYGVVHAAREMSISENRPILIEALTYRVGHHSTSDDSTKYRLADEIEWWKMARDPVTRFRKWIESNGWWSSEAESQFRSSVRIQLLHAIQVAEKAEKPPATEMFTDVYDVPPSNLQEQEKLLKETIKRHPQDYPSDVPVPA